MKGKQKMAPLEIVTFAELPSNPQTGQMFVVSDATQGVNVWDGTGGGGGTWIIPVIFVKDRWFGLANPGIGYF
jgi:hypothetical protein